MNTIKKFWTAIIYIVGFSLAFQPALAAPAERVSATLSTPGTEKTLVLPQAAENTQVISLGLSLDPKTGLVVEGIMFIHKKAKASGESVHAKGPKSNACYSYLGTGAKWKGTPESWVMNTANTRGLDGDTVFGLEAGAINKWEDAADGSVGSGLGVNILGNGSATTSVLTADSAAPDDSNEIYFADITGAGSENTIAVTIVWGIFGGPISGRQLVEWDMVIDDVTFNWSVGAIGEAGKMDFDNIVTHEVGHAVGMGHPSNSCTEETMYAYAGEGETKKRDLNSGDINGIKNLY